VVYWNGVSKPFIREFAMFPNPWLRVGILNVLMGFGAVAAADLAAAETEKVLGRPAPEFRLSDPAGKEHSFSDSKDARLVVVVFVGTECPLSRLYAPRLKRLAAEYAGRGVQFLGIDSNLQDTPAEIAGYASEYGISFPILKDPLNKVADQFAALRTPEAFLLDEKRVIRYHGRIDDQFGVGVRKEQLGRRDLAMAIDELLDDKSVSGPEQPAVGCFIGRVPEPTAGEVTYSREVARIFQRHCIECHRKGEIAPFALTSYDEALGWGETIREVVSQGRMPPWFADPKHGEFINDARLSDEEKRHISQWVDGGCPRGDDKDLPEPRKFADGWNIPEPELVLKMSKKPFVVPAEGVVDYQHFAIDPGFSEDKWVVASEARPGNRSVVHHILVFLKPPGGQYELLRGSLLAAYAPGSPARKVPEGGPQGLAKRIPAGSQIIMQIHYTPNGKVEEDISSLGLVFCDAKDVKQQVESGWATNFAFVIPPGAKDFPLTSQYRFDEDRMLLNLTPHMHVRGKSIRYEAIYPDGRREVLLNVPHWDFNWQLDYELAEPKLMPKGTVLRCEAHFDNSAANPANPDPTKWVRWGEQTWDEMLIGWFMAATLPRESKTSRTEDGGT
jgi:peroxiredoxin